MQWDYNLFMKKSPAKTPKKAKNLEEKVDFIVEFIQTKLVTKDELEQSENRLKKLIDIKADKADIARLTTQIDGLAKQIKDYHQEMIMFTRKVERMEAWIKKVSLKVGIPYEF